MCDDGFELDEKNESCEDINECSMLIATCSVNSTCSNSLGSYECHDFLNCIDKANIICHEKANCVYKQTSYVCECEPGYYGDGEYCLPGSCSENFKCPLNMECESATSIICICKAGLEPNEDGVCEDTHQVKNLTTTTTPTTTSTEIEITTDQALATTKQTMKDLTTESEMTSPEITTTHQALSTTNEVFSTLEATTLETTTLAATTTRKIFQL